MGLSFSKAALLDKARGVAQYIRIEARREARGEVENLFESWLVKHGKTYKDLDEKKRRFEIFKDRLRHINEHNSNKHGYKKVLNQFSDMTEDEMSKMYSNPYLDPEYGKKHLETIVALDYKLGFDHLSDMIVISKMYLNPYPEYGKKHLETIGAQRRRCRPKSDRETLPVVTPIKDQGSCGELSSSSNP